MSKQHQLETIKQAVYDFEHGYCTFMEVLNRLNQSVVAEDLIIEYNLDMSEPAMADGEEDLTESYR
jgi:hypothetical protein